MRAGTRKMGRRADARAHRNVAGGRGPDKGDGGDGPARRHRLPPKVAAEEKMGRFGEDAQAGSFTGFMSFVRNGEPMALMLFQVCR